MTSNPLHLYRALLRECTYLPDPNSRVFIKKWVGDRYRRYLPRNTAKQRCVPIDITPEREAVLLYKARRLVRTLNRANDGQIRPFELVLNWTYARLGARRREMMANLTAEDRASTSREENEQPQDCSERFTRNWRPSATIMNLLRRQQQNYAYQTFSRAKISPQGPRIDEKNRWGKPMPLCRVHNQMKKWYAKNLDLIQLPLPDNEYSTIKALATGERRWNIKPHRTAAAVSVFAPPTPAPTVDLSTPPSRRGLLPSQRPHKLTSRFLRRRMANLLKNVPLGRPRKEKPDEPVAIKWNRAEKSQMRIEEPSRLQASVLFG